MREHQAESFWWEEVAGPYSLVRNIVDAVSECKNVILSLPADIPWRHQMRNSVRSVLESTPGLDSLYIEILDVEDVAASATPGELILNEFALYEDRIRYRAGKESIHHYSMRKGLLNDKIVWIKGANRKDTELWIEFCRQWRPNDSNQGVFVIEDRWGIGDPTRALHTISYSECIDDNSVRLFAWSILAQNKLSKFGPVQRRYAVSLLANLCKDDVEVAVALLDNLDIQHDDPLLCIREIASSDILSRRGEPTSAHVLALAREGREDELQHRLWTAQIEVLFPIIEEERIAIIDRLEDELSALIEEKSIKQFEILVTEAHEVELGTLVYLMSSKTEKGDRKLYVSNHEIRDRIIMLWRCRNLLAHRKVCSPNLVDMLLNGI